jgi:hypothetical protein
MRQQRYTTVAAAANARLTTRRSVCLLGAAVDLPRAPLLEQVEYAINDCRSRQHVAAPVQRVGPESVAAAAVPDYVGGEAGPLNNVAANVATINRRNLMAIPLRSVLRAR